MPFNSYSFLFVFLPLALLGYYLVGKSGSTRLAIIWLIAASLVFYAWSSPLSLVVLIGSVLFNFALGTKLAQGDKSLLIFGLVVNILLLGYFKYVNFLLGNAGLLFDSRLNLDPIVLPLAVSFVTIQQVSYLVDIYRGGRGDHSFLQYCLFITFFPKLLSGPIVRAKEMMPQLSAGHKLRLSSETFAVGLTTLVLGLFKKVLLGDTLGVYASSVFDAAARGATPGLFDSWFGALAYTCQLYFDFSGYSDMAIGLGLMFGIRLPLNFYSPYKARSIIDFWRRWHMTLSSFARDYIYIPLGGNRKGFLVQGVFLLVTMSVIGLWHGAGWTFVIWGALHGFYLLLNHAWRRLRKTPAAEESSGWSVTVSTALTFLAVTVAWVFFRADSVPTALVVLKGMMGMNGLHQPLLYGVPAGYVGTFLVWIASILDPRLPLPGLPFHLFLVLLAALLLCWIPPNVQEFMARYQPALNSFKEEGPRLARLRWEPTPRLAAFTAFVAVLAILNLGHLSNFIYFQF